MSAADLTLRELVRELLREELPAAVRRALRDVAIAGGRDGYVADEFMSTAAAARLADVKPCTIREWVRVGRLPRHTTPADEPRAQRKLNARDVRAPAGRLRIRRRDLVRLLAGERGAGGEQSVDEMADEWLAARRR